MNDSTSGVPARGSDTSPFESIRRVDDDGEFWSARDLMPMAGYSTWQHFTQALWRAASSVACPSDALKPVNEYAASGRLRRGDFRLTRFGAELAMKLESEGWPIECQDCSTPLIASRSTKRWCVDCQAVRRGRRPILEKRPVEVAYGEVFAKRCQRCDIEIEAVRASKRFCPPCLRDENKPVRDKRRTSRAHALRKRGLTLADYDAMVAERNGCCDICGNRPVNQKGSLCVDHDHVTGVVRGLLCSPCNRAIGLLGDTPEGLARAVGYLVASRRPLRLLNGGAA